MPDYEVSLLAAFYYDNVTPGLSRVPPEFVEWWIPNLAVGRKIAFSVLRKAGCYLIGAASGERFSIYPFRGKDRTIKWPLINTSSLNLDLHFSHPDLEMIYAYKLFGFYRAMPVSWGQEANSEGCNRVMCGT